VEWFAFKALDRNPPILQRHPLQVTRLDDTGLSARTENIALQESPRAPKSYFAGKPMLRCVRLFPHPQTAAGGISASSLVSAARLRYCRWSRAAHRSAGAIKIHIVHAKLTLAHQKHPRSAPLLGSYSSPLRWRNQSSHFSRICKFSEPCVCKRAKPAPCARR